MPEDIAAKLKTIKVLRIFYLLAIKSSFDPKLHLMLNAFLRLIPKIGEVMIISVSFNGIVSLVLTIVYKDSQEYCENSSSP
jgi:hypothetical protein